MVKYCFWFGLSFTGTIIIGIRLAIAVIGKDPVSEFVVLYLIVVLVVNAWVMLYSAIKAAKQ